MSPIHPMQVRRLLSIVSRILPVTALTPRRWPLAVLSALTSLAIMTFAGAGGSAFVHAQTTTTTTIPPLVITISHDVPPGASLTGLPLGVNKTVVNVTNQGSSTLYNEQVVIRVGARPDAVTGVRDLAGTVGVLDIATGGWFHLMASISAGGTASFVVTWTKVCPGRFPIAVRVGDTQASQILNWVGSAPGGTTCPPDETAVPQPASYYLLPWPPSVATATTLVPTTVPPTTSTVPTTTSTTLKLVSTVVPSTTLVPTTTTPPTTTVLSTTTTVTTTVTTTITTTTKPTPTTLFMLFCKTVGKTRVCTPRSSKPVVRPTTTKVPKKHK